MFPRLAAWRNDLLRDRQGAQFGSSFRIAGFERAVVSRFRSLGLGFCVGDCFSLPVSDRVRNVPADMLPEIRFPAASFRQLYFSSVAVGMAARQNNSSRTAAISPRAGWWQSRRSTA